MTWPTRGSVSRFSRPASVGCATSAGFSKAATEFRRYQQQDDLLHPSYLETLIEEAYRRPGAAVVYCDMETFGDRTQRFESESVVAVR